MPEPQPKPRVVTLGCRLNALESEVIRGQAVAAGLSRVVVVNTCAVTAEAVRQARQTIRRLRRQHPGSRIVVTGCAAQLDPEMFAAMPEVDRVVGNREKLDAGVLARDDAEIEVADIMATEQTASHLLAGFEGRARAFAQVQQGCDHRCTFCIIPFARGPSSSLPPAQVIAEVRRLADAGFREVVLTGVDLCAYGNELPDRPTLGDLVRRLLRAVPELPRLRLSSLDPAAIDETLLVALADEERLMPHWHLSLQAGDDMILKRMKRRHNRADVEAVVARARRARPDIAFGADLIAGFPTESEAMFANTLAAIDDLGLTYLHVFPFSPRPGTPAARMPQLPRLVREQRAQRLRAAGDRARRNVFNGRIGSVTSVLVETVQTGRCPYYAPVRLSASAIPGTIVDVRIVGAENDHLLGERLP